MHHDFVEYSTPSLLAPVLGARRDGSASADSSRGLLMTVLGEFVLPHTGSAWTQTLIDLLAGLGVKDKAARQVIARMHEQEWLDRRKVGRQTSWTLTNSARDLLEAGAARIYEFGQSPRSWDGRWLLVMASVPDADRNIRYRMSQGLSWAGFGSAGQGVWISPWADRERSVADLLGSLGVAATSFRAEVGVMGDAGDLAASAWDLPALRHEYEAFLELCDDVDAAAGGRDAAVDLATLVHRWRRFPFLDPDLPDELLPTSWPVRGAASRFAELRTALVDPAGEWWRITETTYTPA